MEQVTVRNLGVSDPTIEGVQVLYPGAFNIWSHYDGKVIHVTAEGLLELGTWIEEHRAEIEASAALSEDEKAAIHVEMDEQIAGQILKAAQEIEQRKNA